MRVVAGTHRGRRLEAPDGLEARPTSGRAREATFNRLESLDLIDGSVVLDLFAGSGALGIEALSRGAAQVVFVDSSPRCVDAVRQNLSALGLTNQARVERSDAMRFLTDSTATFDLALLDPPYEFDGWGELLTRLPSEYAVVESDRAIAVPDGWVELKSSRYGRATIAVLERKER